MIIFRIFYLLVIVLLRGLGLAYEKTFVGLYEKYSKNKVFNLAVTSYSPIIYFNKIKYYLDRGLKTKHVIVFIDISDIDDEKNYYKLVTIKSMYVMSNRLII